MIEEIPESSWAAVDITDIAFSATSAYGAILFDSGCSTHMTPLEDKLRNTRNIPTKVIQAADAGNFTANTAGTLHIDLPIDKNGNTHSITLQNTLLCPDTPITLISLGKLDDAGYTISMKNKFMMIHNNKGELIGKILKIDGLYQIPAADYAYATTERKVSLYEAHCISGHQNYAYVKHMFLNNQVQGIKLDYSKMDEPECRTCMLAKASRYPIASM